MSAVEQSTRELRRSIRGMFPQEDADYSSYSTSRPVSMAQPSEVVNANDESDIVAAYDDDEYTDNVSSESEADFVSDDYDSDSEGSIMSSSSQKPKVMIARAVPALPVKSNMRMSRTFDETTLKTLTSGEASLSRQSLPLERYLSSEEDASSDADDFSEFSFGSYSEDGSSSPRSSSELLARVVSVIFSGKPKLVNVLPSPPSPPSPKTQIVRPGSGAGEPSLFDDDASDISTDVVKTAQPKFLAMDPFAASPEKGSTPRPATPPGGHFNPRSFSLAHKRAAAFDSKARYSSECPSEFTLDDQSSILPSSSQAALSTFSADSKLPRTRSSTYEVSITASPPPVKKSRLRNAFSSKKKATAKA